MKHPETLVQAFIKCCQSNWSEEKYSLYREESKNFLRKKFEDKFEQCRLVVQLCEYLPIFLKDKKYREHQDPRPSPRGEDEGNNSNLIQEASINKRYVTSNDLGSCGTNRISSKYI